jgi:serine/threonine-protein kinase
MTDDPRVQQLLDQLLDAQATPEAVCATCPELLPVVRKRWQQMCRLRAGLDALFPGPEAPTPWPPEGPALPQIPGYEVETVLGRGGMGVVFKARHLKLKRLVALKKLLTGDYASPEELARFRREAEAVAALRHPNIVQIHDAGDVGGRPYFTMEYVEGGTLAHSLAGQPQSPRRAAELVATLASAVQFAHKSGFIHRDLKPSNVLLTAEGTPKITDFGLARAMHERPEFSRSGVPLGTPSYMAPEQALGKCSATAPATDIYALGAVLYEMLSGRPPFVGQSPAEIIQKVIAEEPAPPSRSKGQVPRDLETICLKCLQKSPARRYASAQDLADDLYRFLDGKPVLARPVGVIERSVKWARRRPTQVTLLAVLLLALVAGSVTGIVLWQQAHVRQAEADAREAEAKYRRDRAREILEAAIQQAYASARAERWEDATRTLEDAAVHVAAADSEDWHQRLERAKKDVRFDQTLDDIRQQAVQISLEKDFVVKTFYPLLAAEFSKAFTQSPYDIDGPAETTAARIRASPLAAHTVAALDTWALAAFLVNRKPLQQQLLRIAQLADPDPSWGDRFRTPAAWHDKQALLQLADDAFKTSKLPPTHQLSITGALLRELGEEAKGVALPFRARQLRPADFWSNWEWASTQTILGRHSGAVEFYRVAAALRPGNARIPSHVAASLVLSGNWTEGITEYRTAVTVDPKQGMLRHGLVLALFRNHGFVHAQAECQKGIDADPRDAWPPFSLGVILARKNRNEEAAPLFRKACQLNPRWALAHYYLGAALQRCGRLEEALAAFRDADALERYSGLVPRKMGNILKSMGRHEEALAEFEWILREFDPKNKRQDWAPDDSQESNYTSALLGVAESLVCLGRFVEARVAARAALKLRDLEEPHYQLMVRCLAISEALAPWTAELPALCAGTQQPADPATHLLLAEWLYHYKRYPVASVRCYEAVFSKPGVANEVLGPHRFFAACAAALAGSGRGADAARLTDQEKTALRTKARQWLKAEYDRLKAAKAVDLVKVAQAWQANDDLAGVRDGRSLARLPEIERKEWQALWDGFKPPAPKDLKADLALARAQVDRKQWTEAAESYARFVKDSRTLDPEAWFEYAAVQLLSGDRDGYCQSCKFMLAAIKKKNIRGYLVARMCTLASDPAVDVGLSAAMGGPELMINAKKSWSLTEQGALYYRTKHFKEALPRFHDSLRAEPKPGAAVLNWLWLALACHQLGETDEARSWLNKAATWLDGVGMELPSNADALGLHRHNWLEAHILRREAESLIASPGKK